MNILFISSEQNPFIQPKEGSEQRTQLLLRACADIAQVDVISFVSGVISNNSNCEIVFTGLINKHKNITRRAKVKSILHFQNPYALFPVNQQKAAIVNSIIQKKNYDAIVIRYIPNALECGLLQYADKLILDVDDHPTDVFKSIARQSSSFRARLYHHLQAFQARLITDDLLKKVKHSFTPNYEQMFSKNASYLPNIPFYQTKDCSPIDFRTVKNRIIFIGALGYYANELGVDYFLNNIYPKIRVLIPDVEFYIVGKIPSIDLKNKWESIGGVKVLGFVENITEVYAYSKVVVVPIYHGAGTNIKVLEAMQMNRACVVSSYSTRGFQNTLIDGVDYLIAKNDNMFVEYAVKLLQNEQLNKQIASNGNKKVQKHYSIDEFNKIVIKILQQCM